MMRFFLSRTMLVCGLLVGAAVTLTGGCNSSSSNKSAEGGRVNGGGSTFMAPAMFKLTKEYNSAKNAQVDYVSKGSSAGIQQMSEKTLDYGGTDAALNKAQLSTANSKGGEVVHIPLVIGGVVPGYNLPGVEQTLKFTGPVLADIYLGKIKKWNDKALQDINPGVALPDKDIIAVYRAEGSGTTAVWTEYLAKVSPEFKSTVGAGTNVSFPKGIGVGQKGNELVAGHVERTPGSIGYIELTFALQKKIRYGLVKNKAGKFIEANLETTTAAANAGIQVKPTEEPQSLHELTYSMTEMEGDNVYPVTGVSYLVFYKNLAAEKKKTLIDFIRWSITDGQKLTVEESYAPLPADLVKAIEAKLKDVQ
jgi:phosphate ABC transporter phosphate-binding protein